MKKLLLSALALCVAICAFCQEWNWTDIDKDVQTCTYQGQLFGQNQSISVVRYKASRYRTDIVNDPGLSGSAPATVTSELGARHNGIGAVNGSYFNTSLFTPVTFVKDDGVVEQSSTASNETFRTDGIVAVKGRHKVVIEPCDASSYEKATLRYREVLASGPILLQDGKPVRDSWPSDSFYNRNPRTIMGTTSDGWVYLIVVDGRFNEAYGATIPVAVQIAQLFGLEDAINLDGGGSSTLWTKANGVISHPCDNNRFDHNGERKVPNAIVFR